MENKILYLDITKVNQPFFKEINLKFKNFLKSGHYILGNELVEFEKKFAKFSRVKYSIGVANGLDAITLSLRALNIGVGDEVIVPSNTYIATLIAVSNVGAKPVLVEPNINTYNLDPQKIREAISKKTKAIIPVHLFGQACEMDEILKIANDNNLFIIEDNAQSHGSKYNDKITGSFGKINATSFYPGKNLGAFGDAGAITTNDKILKEKIFLLRNYGSKTKYVNDVIGYNSRLDELQAAFLSVKLKGIQKINKQKQKIANKYITGLINTGDIVLPVCAKGSTHVYHVFVIRTKKRNELQKYLGQQNIQTLIHYPIPPHLSKAYKFLGFKKGDFPIAEELANTSLSLPIYPGIKNSDVEKIIKTIKIFFKNEK